MTVRDIAARTGAAPSLSPSPSPPGMRLLAGGAFAMGSDRFYPEEAPVRRVCVGPFWIDETPVTNAAFRRFVAATGHVTEAEVPPDPRHYPGLSPAMARAGSAVFTPPTSFTGTADASAWWSFRFGANWREPLGPGSSLDGLDEHPVVHVTAGDAEAYARWAGKRLPTEAEWEFAARGGLEGRDYAWGDELTPDGRIMANTWSVCSRSRTSRRTAGRGRRRSAAFRRTATTCTT